MSQSSSTPGRKDRDPARPKESTGTLNPGDHAAPGTGGDICPVCRGSGQIGRERCGECGGSGRIVKAIGGG